MFSPERSQPSTLAVFVFVLCGLIVWGLQFTAIYVLHTWFCALGATATATGAASAVLTALAVVLILPVAVMPGRVARTAVLRPNDPDARHFVVIARAVALLSIVAVLWTGGTAAFLQSCALGR